MPRHVKNKMESKCNNYYYYYYYSSNNIDKNHSNNNNDNNKKPNTKLNNIWNILNTSDALWDAFQAVVIQIQCIE
jgi:hypothetical protein